MGDKNNLDSISPAEHAPSENLCSGCTACCHAIVGITHIDLANLAAVPEQNLPDVLKLYARAEFNGKANDPDLALMRDGPRMLALRSTEDGCIFLQKNGNCGIYQHRPRACRSFPYEMIDFKKRNLALKVIPLATEFSCKRATVSFTRSGVGRKNVLDEEEARAQFHQLLRQWNGSPIPRRKRTMSALIAFLNSAVAVPFRGGVDVPSPQDSSVSA